MFISIVPEKFPEIIFAHRFNQFKYRCEFKMAKSNIELTYIKNGDLKVFIDNKEIIAKEGGILILPHNKEFIIEADNDKTHIHYTVSVNVGTNITVDSREYKFTDSSISITLPLYLPPSEENFALGEKLGEIIDEFHISGSMGNYRCACKVVLLLCEISELNKSEEKAITNSDVYCRRIKEYVKQNIDKSINLSDIAVLLEKSPNYLNSVFKAENGITILQYINKEKIIKTIELMTTEGLSLKECGERVGIRDANYLSRMFKKQMGISASVFKMNSVLNTFYLVDKDKL